MKRISLFLPLVILLASCAQVPAAPTVKVTFTATPTQLPTEVESGLTNAWSQIPYSHEGTYYYAQNERTPIISGLRGYMDDGSNAILPTANTFSFSSVVLETVNGVLSQEKATLLQEVFPDGTLGLELLLVNKVVENKSGDVAFSLVDKNGKDTGFFLFIIDGKIILELTGYFNDDGVIVTHDYVLALENANSSNPTAVPTQSPNKLVDLLSILIDLDAENVKAAPLERALKYKLQEMTDEKTGKMLIPRSNVTYPLVTMEELTRYVKKLESEKSRLTTPWSALKTAYNSYGTSEASMVFTGKLRDAVVLRSTFSVQMENGVIIKGNILEVRTDADGATKRSIMLVSEQRTDGMYSESIVDAFYDVKAAEIGIGITLDLPANNAFTTVVGAEYVVDIQGLDQSPVRDRIAETREFYTSSVDELTLFMGWLRWAR